MPIAALEIVIKITDDCTHTRILWTMYSTIGTTWSNPIFNDRYQSDIARQSRVDGLYDKKIKKKYDKI